MGRIGRWVLVAVLLLAAAAGGIAAAAWLGSERALSRVWQIEDPPLPVANDAAQLEHGAYLYVTRSCGVCHGERGEGRLVEDVPPLRLVGSNLTPAGAGAHYDVDAFARAIRHGIRHDGTALVFMPVEDYAELGDADTAALVAYLRSLPPQPDGFDEGLRVKPLGRLLHLFGMFPLVPAEHIDHRPRERAAPAVAATAEYGAYVARTCVGCHGERFTGQQVPGTPPSLPPAPDLTTLADWRPGDFERLMRQGVRPDGSAVHPLMPWTAYRAMSDEELAALFAYFSSLSTPPRG